MTTKKIPINLPFRHFRNHALCAPGVLIWLEGSDEPTLLGDANCLGGGCDCCTVVVYDDVVLEALDLRGMIEAAYAEDAPEFVP